MLDSINIGMTGLNGYAQGLRVIANNTANLNTPGFKSSTQQFADMFSHGGGPGSAGMNAASAGQVGNGLTMNGTSLNFKQGEMRQTGNALDLAVNGEGLFTLKDAQGKLHYTRAGQFAFDQSGKLVNRTDGAQVMGMDSANKLSAISLNALRMQSGKPTATVQLSGNLSSTATEQNISGLSLFDAAGVKHDLTLNLKPSGAANPNSWDLTLMEGAVSAGTATLLFSGSAPTAASALVNLTYSPAGQAAQNLTLDFSHNVTSFAAGNASTLEVISQDGFAAGDLSKTSFDASGTLILNYTNGQTVKGMRLALGRFDSSDAIAQTGGNQFDAIDAHAWHSGAAGDGGFGDISSGTLETSNVDLSQAFSELVILQRGYQASSQIISTANDMLQELFAMKSK